MTTLVITTVLVYREEFLKLGCVCLPTEDLAKCRYGSVMFAVGLRFCLLNEFPGNADAAGIIHRVARV